MIASPGDVQEERNIAREVVYEWNIVHASNQKVVLLPVGWETHSAPIMGDRPQAIINKQVLANSDFLVAIFWTRIGTPTGVAASGTVEEIQEHIRAGKPAAIYFSNTPVRLDTVDRDQYRRLTEFKELCKQQGLIETFDDTDDFRRKFTRQLAKTISDHPHFTRNSSLPGTQPAGQTERPIEAAKAKCEKRLDELIGRVLTGKFHKLTLQQGIFVLSLLPSTISFPLPLFEPQRQSMLTTMLEPLGDSGWSHKISGDRYITHTSNRPDKKIDATTELTVDGYVAAAGHDVVNVKGQYLTPAGQKMPEGIVNIPSVYFERKVMEGVSRYLKCLKELGVGGPWYAAAAIINLKKSILHPNATQHFMFQGSVFEGQEIRPPSIEIPQNITFENQQPIAKALRPIFDYIWREHGYHRSQNYTNDGDWTG
jgi:hypothetical protein